MAMGALICFNCCITEQPPAKRRRPRIDRSMIGEPTNFRHTAHVGSGDVTSNGSSNGVNNIQDQMSSKGDTTDSVSPVAVHLSVIDLPPRHDS